MRLNVLRYLEKPIVDWDSVKEPPLDFLRQHDKLPEPKNKEHVKALLNKLVVIQLNGGLGTAMGMHGLYLT